MNTLHDDEKLRDALHSIYVAQFKAFKNYPVLNNADATRMLTSLMSSHPLSWRVIGITVNALNEFAKHDFKRPPRLLQRGHKVGRSTTAQALYIDRRDPMPLIQFFDFFLKRDETVIMTNIENKHKKGGEFPHYIPIDPQEELFPCGTLMGWQHRKKEVEFLRALHATQPK